MNGMMLFAAAALCAASAPASPKLGETEPSLMMPEGASFEIGADGNFLVDGKPRFLIGNLYYGGFGADTLAKGPGYGDEYAWIYESAPDRAYLQRLGFDTSGGEVSPSWLAKYRSPRRYYQARGGVDWSVAEGLWHSGLPMVVDFTCATWSHGGMKYEKGKKPDESAFVNDCHFIYYSLITPEGRDLWRDFWRSGAEELKAHGAKPYVYELFNEPSYHDKSPAARGAFAAFLSKTWNGDAAAMDRAWRTSYGSFEAAAAFKSPEEAAGLFAAWHKFREECFISGVKLGIETIRAVDPSARFCFQPMSRIHNIVETAAAYDLCEVTMMPTGGGSLYADIALRALSDGKPMIDGETYLGRTRTSHRARLLTQWARGLNASYYFKWERRLREVDMKNPAESLKRLGERYPWLGLNPVFVPPEELVGIMNAKRDIFAMQDLFAPRLRGLGEQKRVATLFSMPTYRLPQTSSRRCAAFAETCANALAVDAHIPLDAVFEEQLKSGRLDRYRILVAAGVDAVYDETPARLEAWVKAGGTLVLVQEALGLDEWGGEREEPEHGFPGIALESAVAGEAAKFFFQGLEYEAVPYREVKFHEGAGWETLASLPNGHAAVARRKVGKGAVYYVGVRFPKRGDEGRLLAAIAADRGIHSTCETRDLVSGADVDGIEVHAARLPGGDTGFVVINDTLAPKAVWFVPGEEFASPVLVDVSRRVVLNRGKAGAALLVLPPSDPVVLRGGKSEKDIAAALESAPSAWNAAAKDGSISHETLKEAFSRAEELFKESASASVAPFCVDRARVRTIDIREQANVPLGSIVNSPPWGATDCAGVPFDFIRPDQNGDRSCVKLGGGLPQSVSGIGVNLRASSLYFLHAGDGAKPGDEIKYSVRYADGTTAVFTAKSFGGFGDLDLAKCSTPLPESFECCPGWSDRKRRGFWVSRWENPYPEKTIASLDISCGGGFAALVAAITAETPVDGCGATAFAPAPKTRVWGGVKATSSDESVTVDFSEAHGWPGVNIDWKSAVAADGTALAADLEFEIETDGSPLAPMQIRIGSGAYHVLSPFLRKTGDGTWRASVPLCYAKGESEVQSIGIQQRGDKNPGCATTLVLRGFRVAWRCVKDKPLELRRFDPEARDGARAIRRDGGIELVVADNEKHWASLQMRLAEPLPVDGPAAGVPEGLRSGCDLVFEVNSGRTPLGPRGTGRQRLRASVLFKTADGGEDRPKLDKVKVLVDGGKIDDDPWTWQTVRVPLSKHVPENAVEIKRFIFQILDMPQDGRSGIVFRNLRFEPAASGN